MAAEQTQGQRHDRIAAPPGNGDLDSPSMPKLSPKPVDGDVSIMQKMLSAVSGSILTSLLVTPLDVVRVRLQAQASPSPTARLPSFLHLPPNLGVTACCREVFWVQNQSQFCVASAPTAPAAPNPSAVLDETASAAISDCAAEETRRKTFNSTLDGLKKIARNEGYLTLWRGLSPTLAMAIPANVIYFTGYDWLRYNHASPLRKLTNDVYVPLIAGSIARGAAAIAVSPVEMFRTRMQATSGGTTGVFKDTLLGLPRMTQSQGYTSLWRGLTLTMWRDVPFSAFYWWGYEASKNAIKNVRHGHSISQNGSFTSSNQPWTPETDSSTFFDSFAAGALSGGIAAFVTTPFDVGKTR